MTTNQPSGPVGSTRPSERELLAFGLSEQFMLFCDHDEFLQIANAVLDKFAARVVGVPEDFYSHQATWRDALEIAKQHAVVARPDRDDKTYWEHELRAFDRAYSELARMQKTQAVPEVAQELATSAEASVDLVARGMRWEECEALMQEACAQAGVQWDDGSDLKSIAVNVMQRLANAAHKVGFKLGMERMAAATREQAIESFEGWAIREFKVPSLDHLKDKVYSHAFVAAMELAWNAARRTDTLVVPIDMVLYCPECHTQHIDAPEDEIDMQCNTNRVPGTRWANPPHRSHLCHSCGYVWRPADVPTNGVAAVKTAGSRDSSPTTKEQ